MSYVHRQFDLVTSRALARSLSRDTRRYRVVVVPSSSLSFSAVNAHGFMGVSAGWKLCKLRRLLISSKTSWSYRRWKITRNSIKFWLIIPGKLPSIFLYIHVESINLKTKPVKIVQSYNEFIERQGKGLETYPAEERIEEHSLYEGVFLFSS